MPRQIQIPYTELRNPLGEITPRPLLTVDLTHQEKAIRTMGLVDSGADVNVLPYGVGIALGLAWGEQRFRLSLSGNLANYATRVVVLAVKVADFTPVDLAFVWTQSESVPVIFGQINFFQTFDVCFFRTQGYFTLTGREEASPVGLPST